MSFSIGWVVNQRNDSVINQFQYEITLSQEDFDRFAVLSGDDNPIHVDPEFARGSRFGRTVAHGMMLYSLVCRGLNKHFPEMVQSSVDMIFPTPTFADEKLIVSLSAKAAQLEENLAQLEAIIHRPDGSSGLEGWVRLVALNADSSLSDLASSDFRSTRESVQEYKGLHLGQQASATRMFSDRDLEEYLALSGDKSRLFEDEDHARQSGFLRRIVPSALLGSMISELLGTHLPGRGTNWLKQQFIFHQPVYLEEVVRASMEIIRLRPDKQLVDLWNSISTPQAGVAATGRSLVLVRDLVTDQGN